MLLLKDRCEENKLEKKIEASILSEESYEPIHSGPIPKTNKPHVVPTLDLMKMNKKLEMDKRNKIEQKKDQKIKFRNSNPGRRANSQDHSDLLQDVIEQVNHNKYGIIEKPNKNLAEKKNLNNRDYEEDEESSLWSWSYWLRKAQGKGGIQDLLAMNNYDFDDSKSHSFHSSILNENKGKYKNLKELRRLFEVMKSYDEH